MSSLKFEEKRVVVVESSPTTVRKESTPPLQQQPLTPKLSDLRSYDDEEPQWGNQSRVSSTAVGARCWKLTTARDEC
ncbi:unnamed protein product [Linum trigynum]